MNRLEFKLDGLKPVSTNEMYSYGRKTVRKSNKYKAFESEAILQVRINSDTLISGKIDRFKEELNKDYRLAIRGIFKFYIPKRSYFRVDTSNYIKATEDIIKNMIGIDDSRNVSIVADKYLSEDKEWHIKVTLEIYQLEYEIPKDKWSKNILGGNNRNSKKITSRIRPLKSNSRIKKSSSSKKTSIELTDKTSSSKRKSITKSIKVEDKVEIILLI